MISFSVIVLRNNENSDNEMKDSMDAYLWSLLQNGIGSEIELFSESLMLDKSQVSTSSGEVDTGHNNHGM